ncbi:hypothetical protein H5T87_07720 [bacterium]|nr:hypothetical protein [bacterium]
MRRALLMLAVFYALLPLWGREKITLDVQVGFNGLVYSSAPYELIKATMRNEGTSSFRGFAGIEKGILEKIELAPGESKSIFLVTQIKCGVDKFSVFSQKKKAIVSRILPCGVPQDEPLQLILPPRQIPATNWLVGLDVGDVPDDWRAFIGVELIVVEGNALEKLNPAQKDSLKRWLQLGGWLVIVGNEELTRGIGEFTASLLPVRNVVKVNLSHPPFAIASLAPIPIKDVPVTLYPASALGEVRLSEGGYPLLVEGRVGWGRVQYWAFQPWAPPFADWQGLFFLLPPPSAKRQPWLVSWRVFPYSMLLEWNLFPANLKGIKNIPFRFLLAFSLIFTYIVIPVLYISLRVKRRTSAYWLSSIVLVFLASLAIFLFGLITRERRIALKELSLTQFYPGLELADKMGVAGIYSPRTINFSLLVDRKDTTLHELDTCGEREAEYYIEDGKKIAQNLRVPPWSVRTYEYDAWEKIDSPLQAQLSLNGNSIRGWVENASDKTLRNTFLIFGQRVYEIGNIRGRERKDIAIDLNKSRSLIGMKLGGIYYPLEELGKRTPFGAMLATSKNLLTNCVLIWEGEGSPSPIQVEPAPKRVERKSLYSQHIPLSVESLPGKVPFISAFFIPSPPPGEEVFSLLGAPPLLGSPFQLTYSKGFAFIPTIQGIKFQKIVIDIQLDSKKTVDILLFLRRGKKTYKMEEVAKGRSPGHITYTIDKPDEFLMDGRYIYSELQQEKFFFGNVEIKEITVYGIPKGG